MELELNRLRTFLKYPKDAALSASVLAHRGFLYLGEGREKAVECYSCRKTFSILNCIDEILNKHSQISPTCCVVNNSGFSNVYSSTTFSPSFSQPLVNCKNVRSAKGIHKGIPAKSPPLNSGATEASLSSFNSESGSTVRNTFFAEFSNSNNSRQRKTNETSCSNTSSFLNSSIPTSVPRITNSDLIVYESSTSDVQSDGLPIISRELDTATPGVSNIGLPVSSDAQGSEPSVQTSTVVTPGPKTEDPETALVQSLTSQSNINISSQTRESEAHVSSVSNAAATGPTYSDLGIITERAKRQEYAVKQKRLETFTSWPRDHHLSPEDLVEAGFYYAGYGDCSRCFFCGGGLRNWEDSDDVWVEHARWFPKCAYLREKLGSNFIDVVQELTKQFDQITWNMVTERLKAPVILNNQENFLKRDPAVKSVVEMGYAEKDVIQIAYLLKEQAIAISADTLVDTLKLEMKTKLNPSSLQKGALVLNRPAAQDILKLKEKNNQLRQQTVCKICLDQEVAVVFLPCGHLVSCTDCASAMKACPVCRTNVKGIVRAFFL
ncbi:baculoviral IAP repeat-containing protein 3 [Biomphalaria pfeifferi]|uniref:Baculoviral IAP repeat-containing protein 3 n=1 Tax=Biomphalaria pfeifferi TaxID=112525 RepID=A0AAD8BYR8_BIOPF|nr:baculoviral IAP repeat-containing protein 3 [Biomphalaria pfeifferi]